MTTPLRAIKESHFESIMLMFHLLNAVLAFSMHPFKVAAFSLSLSQLLLPKYFNMWVNLLQLVRFCLFLLTLININFHNLTQKKREDENEFEIDGEYKKISHKYLHRRHSCLYTCACFWKYIKNQIHFFLNLILSKICAALHLMICKIIFHMTLGINFLLFLFIIQFRYTIINSK